MVAYSFQRRFSPSIEAGTKDHTIRADRRRHAKAGEELQLYEGMRTKACRLLGRPPCLLVGPIRLDFDRGVVECGPWTYTTAAELDHLGRRDGFSDWAEMRAFWAEFHPGATTFSGVIVFWDREYFLRAAE